MGEFIEYTEPIWRSLNMRELKVDEAYLYLKSLYKKRTYLYMLSDECYTCPYTKLSSLQPSADSDMTNKIDVLKLNVAHTLKLKVMDTDVGRYAFENQSTLCGLNEVDIQEFGVYNFTLNINGSCNLSTDKPGVNVNFYTIYFKTDKYLYFILSITIAILSIILLVASILSLIRITWCAWITYRYDELANTAGPATETVTTTTPTTTEIPKQRLRSLDTFRGLSIVLMIFVNSGGGAYWWIEHASWNGLHLADVVFPSFLWIMGVCIPISVKSQLARGSSILNINRKIIWRSLKLFLIGVVLNSINGPQLEMLRVMGVLQRFGVAFFVCGMVHTCFSRTDYVMPQQTWKRALHEIIMLKVEFLVMVGLIIIHLGIVFGLPVQGCPKGYLGPGGKHANAAYPNCIGGAAGYIDRQILGDAHIYQHPTARYVYDSNAFDPEGLFGSLLTIVQVLLGLIAGMIILVHNEWRSRITRWLSWSLLLALLGGLLCLFSKEEGPIPINKNLWSLSFVFVTASLAFLLLSLLYFAIDVRQVWMGFPFQQSGKNAIILYVGHTVMHKMLPWHWKIGAMNTHFVLLLEAVWNTILWIVIALYLDARHFYYSL